MVLPLIALLILSLLIGSMQLMPAPTFGELDNGKTVTLYRGETFRVKLSENPQSGDTWKLTTSDGLLIVGERYVSADRTGKSPNLGGIHSWEIKVIGKDNLTVTAIYTGKNMPAQSQKVFKLNVRVKESLLGRLFNPKAPISLDELNLGWIKTYATKVMGKVGPMLV